MAGQPMVIEFPLTVIDSAGSGRVAGPWATEPSAMWNFIGVKRAGNGKLVENDEVVDWYGWNFVDYEKTRASAGGALYPMAAVSMTTMEDTADLAHGAA